MFRDSEWLIDWLVASVLFVSLFMFLGDIVEVSVGDQVPADMRVVALYSTTVDVDQVSIVFTIFNENFIFNSMFLTKNFSLVTLNWRVTTSGENRRTHFNTRCTNSRQEEHGVFWDYDCERKVTWNCCWYRTLH